VRVAAAALALLAVGFSPLEAEEPHVRAGNARLRAGDPEGALARYAEAEAAVGARPEIAYDRGHAHLAAGRLAEARDAWRQAADAAPPALASRALQNAANALDALGDRDGAIASLRAALVKDPANADARYDLEVLLRRSPSGSAPGGATRPASTGGATSPGSGGEGPGEREREAGAKADAARPATARAEPEPRPGREGERGPEGAPAAAAEGAGAPRPEISRQDAERLLDALRAREQNAPPWSARPGGSRRRDAEKDW
jgi:tetratricopeptide (TPR) repeat protein